MILYPAIDILDGSAVRLVKGDFEEKKVYDSDPLDAARGWTEAGAEYLHVVDLDGAKTGAPKNLENLRRIAGELGVPVQYGGGLRSAQAVSDALAAGAARVILGTVAMLDPSVLYTCLQEHGPEQILVGVDVRGGEVVTHGWLQGTDVQARVALDALHERGVRNFVFTNVDRDGMLEGPDLEEVRGVAQAVKGSLIYSGGIGQLADLEGLAGLREASLEGVIVGKALYERRFTVAQAQAALGS
ncbi:MAG TPA: 1-(5-phosphoribosyl)-5-[(5-phosphoribosylamino)methylideneamino]imidazole-4-carboxamide isomerase [Solirubrobacteraceae bacterium]|jgi:phosphoribosylformimino-5-aminoimidazole carboxamide ribotide isomerase|nr:1-(5-phosphoribosyl)-5-[(5-phosphoribosylamino)methylideneamino]imidazole-4-carboxamide isomerase [Solirubrobacteraceae bacterium]